MDLAARNPSLTAGSMASNAGKLNRSVTLTTTDIGFGQELHHTNIESAMPFVFSCDFGSGTEFFLAERDGSLNDRISEYVRSSREAGSTAEKTDAALKNVLKTLAFVGQLTGNPGQNDKQRVSSFQVTKYGAVDLTATRMPETGTRRVTRANDLKKIAIRQTDTIGWENKYLYDELVATYATNGMDLSMCVFVSRAKDLEEKEDDMDDPGERGKKKQKRNVCSVECFVTVGKACDVFRRYVNRIAEMMVESTWSFRPGFESKHMWVGDLGMVTTAPTKSGSGDTTTATVRFFMSELRRAHHTAFCLTDHLMTAMDLKKTTYGTAMSLSASENPLPPYDHRNDGLNDLSGRKNLRFDDDEDDDTDFTTTLQFGVNRGQQDPAFNNAKRMEERVFTAASRIQPPSRNITNLNDSVTLANQNGNTAVGVELASAAVEKATVIFPPSVDSTMPVSQGSGTAQGPPEGKPAKSKPLSSSKTTK